MGIQFNVSPMILKSIASLYNTPPRVIHENVSNSFDAAEIFFDEKSNGYTKPIEITVTIDGKSHDYARIIIHDNATGISDLSHLITSIGLSSKLNDDKSSGRFAVGIYSFMAICDRLIITTRLSNSNEIKRLELNSDMFDAGSPGVLEEVTNISGYTLAEKREDCWSRFILDGFSKQSFKELNAKTLKYDIEKHFELILNRKNITVKIIDDNKKEHICKAFNYDSIEGGEFKRELTQLSVTKSKKFKSKEIIQIPNKVVVYLKVSKGRVLDRKPVFIEKGRRIVEISDVKAFRTYSKGSIWSHPNVTGFVDVTGVLEPKISRDDFKPSVMEKALFQALVELEPEIKEFITSQLSLPSSSEYSNLEKYLTKTLNKLTKKRRFHDLIKLEAGTDLLSDENNGTKERKEELTLKAPKRVKNLDGDTLEAHQGQRGDNTDNTSEESAKEDNTSKTDTNVPPNNTNVEIKDVKVEIIHPTKGDSDDTTDKNSRQVKNKMEGLNILIESENDPPLDKNNNPLRSNMINRQIIIYKNHPLFVERVRSNDLGVQTISNELIFYIAIEVMTQIKTMVYNELKKDLPDIGSFFNTFGESVYLFAKELSALEGKNLNEIS